MKLTLRNNYSDREFRCSLTFELDALSGIYAQNTYDLYHHYLLCDNVAFKDQCVPIRVPGGTIGAIQIDDNHVITKLHIDTDYVVRTYPADINEQLQKYIGTKMTTKENYNHED